MAEQPTFKKSPHVLLIPFPAQGHINPLIQFAKRLVSKGVKTTLVNSVYLSKSIPSNTSAIAFESISDGFDEGGSASADSSESYLETFREVGSKSLAHLIKKLHSEGNIIDAIVYDAFVSWALDVAMEFAIDGGSFFTQACGVNNIYYHVHKGFISVPIETGSTVSVPGLPLLDHLETPSFVYNPGPYPGWCDILFNQFSNINQARWVFSNTFYKLEEEVIEWMRKMWQLKVIGPTVPSMYLDKRLKDDIDYGITLIKPNHAECMNWLNERPKGSVIYVSFGSYSQHGPEQLEEVAWGLNDSNMNFLWIVRADEEERLPKWFLDQKPDKGLVVSWCKQLEVLAHESVGCFVTHCGFNSTLEALSLGVPVVAMPIWTDQTTNAKFLEDVWGVGVRVKADEKGIVRRENIVSCIKEIIEGERGLVVKRNATKWRELAKEAVDEGGSSDKDINDFVYELNRS